MARLQQASLDLPAHARRGYVPVPFAAQVAKRPEQTIYSWVRHGKVRSIQVNGRTMVSWVDTVRLAAAARQHLRGAKRVRSNRKPGAQHARTNPPESGSPD